MSDQFDIFNVQVPGGTYNTFSGTFVPDATNPLAQPVQSVQQPPVQTQPVQQVSQQAVQNPLAQPTQAAEQPAGDGSLFDDKGLNFTGYLKANNFENLSQEGQLELFKKAFEQVEATYPGGYKEGDLATLASKIPGSLIESKNGVAGKKKLSDSPVSDLARDLASTALQMATGLGSAAAGLLNAGLDNEFSHRLARGTFALDEAARKTASRDQQDYHKRLGELWDQGRYFDALSSMVSNPVDTASSIAAMVGPTLGATALVKGAAKGAGKLLGKEAAEATARSSALKEIAPLAIGGGLVGGGQTAQTLGAGRDGHGNFDLSASQRAAVLGSTAANTALTGLSAKFGVSPESLIANVGKAKSLDAAKNTLKTMFGSTVVEAATNAPSAALDAALATGYDKDGNFDGSRVDMNEVAKAMGQAATISTVTGGTSGAIASRRAKAAVSRDARGNLDVYRQQKDEAADTLDGLNPEQMQAKLEEESRLNAELDAQYQKKRTALETLSARAYTKGSKQKYQDQISQLEQEYNELREYNPVKNAIDTRAAEEGNVTPVSEEGNVERTAAEETAPVRDIIPEDEGADPLQSLIDVLGEDPTLKLPSPDGVTPAQNPLDVVMQLEYQKSSPEAWGGHLYTANRNHALAQKNLAELQARVRDTSLSDKERQAAASQIRRAQQDVRVTGRYRDMLFSVTPPGDPSLETYRLWDGIAQRSEAARERAIQAHRMEQSGNHGDSARRAAELDHLADMKERQAQEAEASMFSNVDQFAAQLRQQAQAHRAEADSLLKGLRQGREDIAPEALRASAPDSYRNTRQRLEAESQPLLLDDVDTVMEALQTPENLGPRQGQTFREEPRFPEERTFALRGAEEANNNPASQALSQAAAELAENPLARPSGMEAEAINPLALSPELARGGNRREWVEQFAAMRPTASTVSNPRAMQWAQTLLANPGVRDPLNVGLLVPERTLVSELPGAVDPMNMVARLMEAMDRVRGHRSKRGVLASHRENLQDILDAYRMAYPDAYAEAASLHGALKEVDVLAQEIHPAGKIEGQGPVYDSNPAMLAHLRNGDIISALREVKGEKGEIMPMAQQLITILKNSPGADVVLHDGPITGPDGIMYEAVYIPELKRIVIDENVADRPYYLLHEATHHVISDAFTKPEEVLNEYQVEALTTLRQMFHEFSRRTDTPPSLIHAKRNEQEFISEVFSNPQMQAWMTVNRLKTTAKQHQRWYFSRLVDSVRRFFGLEPKQTSALTDIVGLTHMITGRRDLVQKPDRTLNNFGMTGKGQIMISAELMKDIKNRDGSDGYMPLGNIVQQQSGVWRVTMNDGTVEDFDTSEEATAWAYDTYQAKPRHASASEVPINSASTTAVDRLNPAYMEYRDKVLNLIGEYGNERAQEMAAWAANKLETFASYLYSVNVDRLSPFQLIDNIANRNGLESTLYEDAVSRENKARSVVGRPGAALEQIVSGMRKAIRENGINEDEFRHYVYARRTIELNDMYKERVIAGVPLRTTEDLSAFSYEANGRKYEGVHGAHELLSRIGKSRVAQYESILAPMRDMNQRILEAELRAGLLDEAGFAKLSRAYYYVPLLSPGTEGYVSHKRLQGRTTKAEDPLVSMMLQMQRRWGMVYRNEQLRDLYQTINKIGLGDYFTLDTVTPRYNTQDEVVGMSDQPWNDKDAVWVFLGDKKARIHVKTDTLEGQSILRAIKAPESGPVLNLMRAATGMMSASMTSYNPKFLVTTPVWDTVMTLLNFSGAFDRQMDAQTHYALAMKSVREAAQMLPQLARERLDGYTDDPMRQLFAEYGGGINAGAFYGLDAARKSLNALNNASPIEILREKGVKGAGAAALSAHDKFLNVVHSTDEAFRYSAFVNYLEYASGADLRSMSKDQLKAWAERNQKLIERAAQGSRDLTGNFSRRGSGTVLPAWFAFWNAGMQSAPLVLSVMSTAAGRYGMVALAALGALTAENAVNDPDDVDADGGSKFARSKSRESSLLFGQADGGFAVPLAYEARPFVIGTQNLWLWARGKLSADEALTGFLKSLSAMLIPVQPAGGEDISYSLARMMFPTVAQPIISATMGVSEFGTDIDNPYPIDDMGRQIANPADRERGKASTPQFLKDTANGLYNMFGVDVSPARMDALLQGYLGGMYTMVRNSIQPPPTKQGLTDNPTLGYITANFAGRADDYAVNDEYTNVLTKYSSAKRSEGLEATGSWNVLAGDQDPVAKIAEQRDKERRNIRIDGYKRSEIQGMLQVAYRNGDEAAIELNLERLRKYQQLSNEITGRALQEMTGVIGDY